ISTIAAFLPTLKGLFLALTGPIGLVIAAVAGLAAVAFIVYQNWDNVVTWLKETWESLSAWASSIFESLSQTFDNVVAWLSDTWNSFKEGAIYVFEQVVNYFKELPDRIM